MIEQPLYILAVLFFLVFLSEYLCKHTFLRYISSSLLVIILGAVAANIGIIPSASGATSVYEGVFKYIAPASIFFLLLGVDMKELKKAGGPMLVAFLLGSLGTMIGVFVSLSLIDQAKVFGANAAAIAGMMTGTYTGGSANFNAVALHYQVFREGAVFTGVMVADNIITALWMVVTLLLPALMNRWRPQATVNKMEDDFQETESEQEQVGPSSIAVLLLLVSTAMLMSDGISSQFSQWGVTLPSILILTTIALVLAQIKIIQRLNGAKVLGMFSIYIFLAVVGAFCEIEALAAMGTKALDIFIFTIVMVLIHGVVLVLGGVILRSDWSIIAIASQANIGGPSTAIALAKSFKRSDLMLPAILAGSLGAGIGTYLGFLVAGLLGA